MAQANAEQLLAIEHKGGVLLSAGAGSGKTFVLVEHLVFLVRQHYETKNWKQQEFLDSLKKYFGEIVLMTFTKKATGEMAIRIKKRFTQLKDEFAIPNAVNPWECALKNLDFLNVSTIDSFCSKLIKQGFFDGAPETISVLSQTQAKEKLSNLFNQWLERELQYNTNNEILERILSRTNTILDAYFEIFSDPNLRTMWKQMTLTSFTKESFNREFEEAFRMTDFYLVFENPFDPQKYSASSKNKWFSLWSDFFSRIPKPFTLEAFRGLVPYVESIERMANPSAKENYPELVEVKDHLASFKKFVEKYGEDFLNYYDYFDDLVLPTLTIYKSIFDYMDSHYNDIPGIVFADLSYIVNSGLDDSRTRENIQSLYKYYIVDEFQDTSFVQFSILEKLVNKDYSKLFCVGDLKQAIYGFRGGEVKVFKDLSTKIPLNLNLTNNYRSSSNVIHFNNFCFEYLFRLGINFEGNDLHQVPVKFQTVPENLDQIESGYLKKINVTVPQKFEDEKIIKYSNDEINELEANAIFHYLNNNLENQKQFCILYRSLRPSLHLIHLFLKNKISFTSQVKIPFLQDPLIGLFQLLIEFLLNKRELINSNSLILFRSYLLILGKDISVIESEQLIVQFKNNISLFGLKTATTTFLFNCGLSNSNYQNNLSVIYQICDEKAYDLSLVWQSLEELKDSYSFEFEYGANPKKIIIMTAHASKGLEFENVIIAGIHTNGRSRPDSPFLGKIPGSFKWKYGKSKTQERITPYYWLETLTNKHKEFGESKRLFYVACTRAQKNLIWVDFKDSENLFSKPGGSWIQGLRKFEESLNESKDERHKSILQVIQTGQDQHEIQELFEEERLPTPPFFHFDSIGLTIKSSLQEKLNILSELSVTKLAMISECPRKFYLKNICKFEDDDLQVLELTKSPIEYDFIKKEEISEEESSVRAMSRGTMIHETISWMLNHNWVKPLKEFSTKDESAIDWIFEYLTNLKNNSQFISEQTIKFPIFGYMITGTPDLVIIPDNNSSFRQTVVDYKTGKRKIEGENNYWFQLYTYAYALFTLKQFELNQEVDLVLTYVDEKQVVSKTVSYKNTQEYIFSHLQKLDQLNEVNQSHCPSCPYKNLCSLS